jgi:tetratricopeptide (TPR) repeat protein
MPKTPQTREKMQAWPILLLLLALASASPLFAAPGLAPQTVRQLYQDGEFEKVRTHLEAFLKRSDATASRDERILAYKYLGVVYASKPEGAPQAEAYFFRLLDLSPNVQLTELYVSSSVNSLFEKTQQRFLKEKQTSSAVDEYGYPIASRESNRNGQGDAMARAAEPKPIADGHTDSKAPIRNTPRQNLQSDSKGPKIWPWVLGAAVVGGGIGLYVMTSGESDSKKETIINGTTGN